MSDSSCSVSLLNMAQYGSYNRVLSAFMLSKKARGSTFSSRCQKVRRISSSSLFRLNIKLARCGFSFSTASIGINKEIAAAQHKSAVRYKTVDCNSLFIFMGKK